MEGLEDFPHGCPTAAADAASVENDNEIMDDGPTARTEGTAAARPPSGKRNSAARNDGVVEKSI